MAKSVSFAAAAALLFALVAIYVGVLTGGPAAEHIPPVSGRNNTVLFIVLPHHGLSNVHLATADALLERHPDISTEFASFPKLEAKVNRISSWGQKKSREAKPIKFHNISGRDYSEVIGENFAKYWKGTSQSMVTPPGLPGLNKLVKQFALFVAPWPAEEHLEMYYDLRRIIDEVDPAVVVLDSLFTPAADATRESNRLHAFITPNTLSDNFAAKQPWGGFFWKYPVLGSGYSFPVPWKQIPSNTYMAIRFIIGVLHTPAIRAKRAYLTEHGLKNPIDFLNLHRDDSPWITQTLPAASIPLDVVPQNVSALGPITVSVAPVAEQDADLSAWLQQHPTVFINLGSAVEYEERQAMPMAAAIKRVLEQRSDVQVLWKMSKGRACSDDFKIPLQEYIDSGRLRLSSWLHADPTSILESGNIIASVHHGGANCYHETVLSGVPHVILPLWIDLYNFASLVETLGVGVWGCPETAPWWTSECLSEAMLKVIDGGEAGETIRRNARRVGDEAQRSPGRYGAARIVAELAGSGY